MYPILFYIGPIAVKTSWIFDLAGVASAFFILHITTGKETPQAKQRLYLLAALLFIPFLGGMHAGYIIEEVLSGRSPYPVNIMGPYSLLWGFISAIIFAFPLSKILKTDVYISADYFAPAIPAAMIFVRTGCLFNGCCRGIEAPAGFPFIVFYPGSECAFYPAPLLEALAWVFIFTVVLINRGRTRFRGGLFSIMIISYSFFRFFIEFIRSHNGNPYISRILCLLLVLIFMIYYINKRKNLNL